MKTRTITTLVLWGAVIGMLTVFGVYGGLLLLLLLSGLAQYETYGLLGRIAGEPATLTGVLAGSLLLLLGGLLGLCPTVTDPMAMATAFVVPALVVAILIQCPARIFTRRLFPTLLGFFLIPFCLLFLIVLATHPAIETSQGLFLVVWLVAVAKFSDIGALLVGRKLGRRKLAPDYSPKKTVEGAIGGILASMLVALLLPLLFSELSPPALGPWFSLLFGFLIGIVAIASDLVGSALKRQAGVKDSGNRIPGIGGGLDLVDSLLLSAPLGYGLLAAIL